MSSYSIYPKDLFIKKFFSCISFGIIVKLTMEAPDYLTMRHQLSTLIWRSFVGLQLFVYIKTGISVKG
jgi:hypothetical protein